MGDSDSDYSDLEEDSTTTSESESESEEEPETANPATTEGSTAAQGQAPASTSDGGVAVENNDNANEARYTLSPDAPATAGECIFKMASQWTEGMLNLGNDSVKKLAADSIGSTSSSSAAPCANNRNSCSFTMESHGLTFNSYNIVKDRATIGIRLTPTQTYSWTTNDKELRIDVHGPSNGNSGAKWMTLKVNGGCFNAHQVTRPSPGMLRVDCSSKQT